MVQVLPILERMLKPGLEIKIAAQAKLNGMHNSISLSSSLPEPLTFSQMPLLLVNPKAVLQKLASYINASLANSLVDLEPIVAGMIAHNPRIEATADDY